MKKRKEEEQEPDDIDLLTLYLERDSLAIELTDRKYRRLCISIAQRILGSREDSEECVNDVYLHVWESIPPNHPERFSAYLAKITRNLALDRYRYLHARKRSWEIDSLFSEMNECIPEHARTEEIVDNVLLIEALNSFLGMLPEHKRNAFIQRYWYACSLENIAKIRHSTVPQVKSMLFRIREELRCYLENSGIPL